MSARHSGCCISTGSRHFFSAKKRSPTFRTSRILGRNATFSGLKSILFKAERGESSFEGYKPQNATHISGREGTLPSLTTSIIKRSNLRRKRKDRHQIQSQTTPKGGGTLKKGRGREKVISMQFCPDGGGGGRQSIIPPQTVHF